MNTTVTDPVFGEMVYSHSWSRKETISWWLTCEVKISAKAFKYDSITEKQREAFKDYKSEIDDFVSEAIPKIKTFLEDNYDIEPNLTQASVIKILHPQIVLFLKDGAWGVLFDSDLDVENGLGVFKVNGVVKVGKQDDFI